SGVYSTSQVLASPSYWRVALVVYCHSVPASSMAQSVLNVAVAVGAPSASSTVCTDATVVVRFRSPSGAKASFTSVEAVPGSVPARGTEEKSWLSRAWATAWAVGPGSGTWGEHADRPARASADRTVVSARRRATCMIAIIAGSSSGPQGTAGRYGRSRPGPDMHSGACGRTTRLVAETGHHPREKAAHCHARTHPTQRWFPRGRERGPASHRRRRRAGGGRCRPGRLRLRRGPRGPEDGPAGPHRGEVPAVAGQPRDRPAGQGREGHGRQADGCR